MVSGKVISEKNTQKTSIFIIEENNKTLEIICFCRRSYINKTLLATGTLEIYNNKTQLVAEKITLID